MFQYLWQSEDSESFVVYSIKHCHFSHYHMDLILHVLSRTWLIPADADRQSCWCIECYVVTSVCWTPENLNCNGHMPPLAHTKWYLHPSGNLIIVWASLKRGLLEEDLQIWTHWYLETEFLDRTSGAHCSLIQTIDILVLLPMVHAVNFIQARYTTIWLNCLVSLFF